MKRNIKPFSVEIKKSRVQGHHLPPRRLFATVPDEATTIFQKEEPQAVAEPVVPPRILPSILAAVPSNSEPIMPVSRKRALSSKVDQGQIDLDLHADTTRDVGEGVADALLIPEAGSQMDVAPVAEKSATPVHAVRLQDVESGEPKARTRRKKASELVEPVAASQSEAPPAPVPEADLIAPSGVVTSSKSVHSRLTRRQAAAVQLPRSERWKRRLHPASW